MTNRRKARMLATIAPTLAFLSTGYSAIWGEWWWAKLFNLVLFGMTCGVSTVTWVSKWCGFDPKLMPYPGDRPAGSDSEIS